MCGIGRDQTPTSTGSNQRGGGFLGAKSSLKKQSSGNQVLDVCKCVRERERQREKGTGDRYVWDTLCHKRKPSTSGYIWILQAMSFAAVCHNG